MSNKHADLSTPFAIRNILTKNRIVLPPMETKMADNDGLVTQSLIDHYVKRAEGGAGLIIIEHSYVDAKGKLSLRQLANDSEDCVTGFEKLTEAIHEHSVPVICQLTHAGAKSEVKVTGSFPFIPSRNSYTSSESHVLKAEDIVTLRNTFVAAAIRAKKGGFDGVEVHGAHGFLLNQFSSAATNHREDNYGGNVENRIRLSCEIISLIRKYCGENFTILYRLASDDRVEGGITIAEGVKMAKLIQLAGADIIDVSGGLCGSRPSDLNFPGFFVPQAGIIKKAVTAPVIGVGGITTGPQADEVIKDNKADLVAVGRAFLKEPNWGNHALLGLGYSDS